MNKFLLSASILMGGGFLAGCASDEAVNQSQNSVNIPVISQTVMIYDLAASSGELSANQLRALSEWLESIGAGYGDRFTLDVPRAGGAPVVREQVERVLAGDGLLLSDVGPITAEAVPAGSIRLVVQRARVSVPGCPDQDSLDDIAYANATSSNYGCSVNSAIASMIADPNDLLSGKPYSGTSPERSAAAIAGQRGKVGKEKVTNAAGTVGN